jgi:thiol oxidase
MFLSNVFILTKICFLIIQLFNNSNAKDVFLYNQTVDHIAVLGESNFEETVFNSDKASIVEFYAHWCGRCKRWAQHWKDLAKQTILWHKSIMRVGAVDCAISDNRKLCRYHKVEFFPTFYMFQANAQKTVGVEANFQHTNEQFSEDMVNFIGKHKNRPAFWPSLEVFEYAHYTNITKINFFNFFVVVVLDRL